jgi:glycosyltransferase involved in cell wall biosynthesis
MRVLTFLHSFEPGGVERIALRLVRQWRAQGVDAPLFLGRADGDMRHDVAAGLDFICARQPWRTSTARWETLWMIMTLPRAVRRLRPDVLFCAGNTYAIVSVALRLMLGRRCPPIVAKISNDLDRRDKSRWRLLLYRAWLWIQGRCFDHVVGMESPMAAEIAQHLHIGPHAISIIPDPALSCELIERLRATVPPPRGLASGRRFVAVGRLAPQKNLALMLRAFARGCQDGDRLTIIGDGPERGRLEILARRLGVGDRVEFKGYLPDPALMMPAFDILLLSSNYEGVPAVILEALAARLWIIATTCSRSINALLLDGRLGNLVPVGDEILLAQAIAAARPGNQDEDLSLAQAKRFAIEESAEAYLRTMAGLCKDGARQRIFAAATEVPPMRAVEEGEWET